MRFIFLLLLLVGCKASNLPSQSPVSPQEEYENQNFFFDLDREGVQYDCPIQGTIPSWLSGTLLRNGPAKFTVEGKRVKSWFDGLAMIHAFAFNVDRVSYSNQFLRSKQYYQMMVEKSMDFSGFAQDPCGKAFKNQSSQFIPAEMKDVVNAVVSIAKYGDKTVALTEIPLPVVFDPESLATIGPFEYPDNLPKSQTFESAHPQHDTETINYLVRFGRKSSYVLWKLKENAREVFAEVPVKWPSYMHSFAMTEKFVILVEYPFVVKPIDLQRMNKPFIANYKWKPELGTNFLVIDRSSGILVAKIKTDPFFAFHHVNAFDKGNQVVIDVITYPDASIIEIVSGTVEPIYAKEHPQLHRYTLSLENQSITKEKIVSEVVEMPRVAASVTARPYQYCYAVDYTIPTSVEEARALYKINVNAKSSKSWSEKGCFPGEPIFVPNPEAQDEDDGVVLSLILDYAKHRSFLLILDAKNFTELARADAPHAIPVGLHGLWQSE